MDGLDRDSFDLTLRAIHPRQDYPFPWSVRRFFGIFPDGVLGAAPEVLVGLRRFGSWLAGLTTVFFILYLVFAILILVPLSVCARFDTAVDCIRQIYAKRVDCLSILTRTR